jgi:hypothetical protein
MMTTRWSEIERLYYVALERAADDTRLALTARVCC